MCFSDDLASSDVGKNVLLEQRKPYYEIKETKNVHNNKWK